MKTFKMYRVLTVCWKTANPRSLTPKRQCVASALRPNKLVTLQCSHLSSTVKSPRFTTQTCQRHSLLGQRSARVLSVSVRHASDKLIDLNMLKLPKKIISWKQRMTLQWKLGDKFNVEDFFKGVRASFVYASECISQGNVEGLEGLLTEEAHENIPRYMLDAQNNNRDIYLMAEDDIVLMKVQGVNFDETEYGEMGNVTVLSMNVWIAYMKDCVKTLEQSNPPKDASWAEVGTNLGEMQMKMAELSRHAEFEYQRVYDENLQDALTDWVISKVTYKVPNRFDQM